MFSDKAYKINHENWWLRQANGSKVQWTSRYDAWDINFTEWSKPDFNGNRYPEWLAERDYHLFFKPVPEFDIWYFDNVFEKPPVKVADWDMNGRNDSNEDGRIASANRRGHVAEWSKAHQLAANLIQMGNADNDLSSPEYKGKLQGAFLEGMMGKSWSIATWAGWEKMMARYHVVMMNVSEPRIVGFNVWGRIDDYRFFRYAFASSLMDDGYFSFTDEAKGYSSVPWFDEYDIKLGKALDPPQRLPKHDGIYFRRFENGLVLVNPISAIATVPVEPGYRRLLGKQDTSVNDGTPVVKGVPLPPESGLILIKQQ
jgi:hypothetical protein